MPPVPALTLVFWSCRGLCHSDSLNYLKEVVKNLKLDIVFLMETKISKGRIKNVFKFLKFKSFFIFEAIGFSM